jgi:outer membrane protein assembly factor BamB
VNQNGNYCSGACKAAMSAREPQLARVRAKVAADHAGESDGSRWTSTLMSLLKFAIFAIVVGGVGFFAYVEFLGPRGRLTATMATFSDMETFHAKMIQPDLVIAQSDDELFAAKMSSQQKLWSKDLRALEQKWEMPKPKATKAIPDSPGFAEGLGGYTEGGQKEYRDRLHFTEANGHYIVVSSKRQLLCFDSNDGSLLWQYYQTNTSVHILAVHEGGILCTISPSYGGSRGAKSQTVNLAFADGKEKWTWPENVEQILPWNGKLVFIGGAARGDASLTSAAGKKPANKPLEGEEANENQSAMAGSYAVGVMALRFISPADGKPISQKALDLPGATELEIIGTKLFVLSGQQLMVFESGTEPVLKTKLLDTPMPFASEGLGISSLNDSPLAAMGAGTMGSSSVAGRKFANGGDAIAMKTAKGILTLDGKTGQQKWVRSGIPAEHLAVAPDGSVYATITLSKDEANKGEAATFRPAVVTEGGFPFPAEGITALLKLDAKTGKTLWGVRNIGRRVMFPEKDLYVIDTVEKVHLFSGNEMFAGHLAVRSLAPRSGKDNWLIMEKAELHHLQFVDKKLFLVITDEAPAGRVNPKCNYKMQVIEKK